MESRFATSVRSSVRALPLEVLLRFVRDRGLRLRRRGVRPRPWMSRDLPTPEQLSAIKPPVKTVYDAEGRELHEFFKENRSVVPLRAIPRHLVNATLSTEDRHFYQHWGVDLWGIGAPPSRNILQHARAEGGSTITQQLARNLFLTHERTLTRKFKEIVVALGSSACTRRRRSSRCTSIRSTSATAPTASRRRPRPSSARTSRSSRSRSARCSRACRPIPGLYSRAGGPAAARPPRARCSRNMLDDQAITQDQFDNAMSAPLGVTPQRSATTARPTSSRWCGCTSTSSYGSNPVYEGGLRVYTTLDIDLQQAAERALEKQLVRAREPSSSTRTRAPPTSRRPPTAASARQRKTPYLQGALVAIDPRTGYIRALVGGRDWNTATSTAPRRRSGSPARRSSRSSTRPRSTTASSPTDIIEDAPVSFPGGERRAVQPRNYDRKFRGPVTLRYALQHSINIPAIKLLRKLGTSLVASYARRMGIKSPIRQNLSLALGTSEVNLLELTVGLRGVREPGDPQRPAFMLKVEDKNGTVLEKNPPQPVDVLSAETAGVMTSMLQSVVDHGTGYPARARGLPLPAAGKTGTTDDYTDAWFVGYTPSLVCGVWVGFDQKKKMGKGVTGAARRAPIWTDFMIAATAGGRRRIPVPRGQ